MTVELDIKITELLTISVTTAKVIHANASLEYLGTSDPH
jgi:hypothetical protein